MSNKKKFEHNAGYGTAFKNENFTSGSNQPYAKGTVKDPDGKEWDIALWIPKNENIKGFSVSLQEVWVNPNENSQSNRVPDNNDDLPFG